VLLATGLAVSIRRENAALLVLASLFLRPKETVPGPPTRRWWLLAAWVSIGLIAGWMFVPSLISEVGEYGTFSFGVGRFLHGLPVISRALLYPQWFGLVALGAGVGFWRARRARAGGSDVDAAVLLCVAVVTVAMLMLYASHVRSTYELAGAAVEPFEFLRYLSNAGATLCILAAPALFGAGTRHQPWKPIHLAAFVLYVGGCVFASWILRRNIVKLEDDVRRRPALQAIAVADELGERFPIVTLEPLLVQLYGSPSIKVISLPFLTPERLREAGGRVLYLRLDRYQSAIDKKRYARGLSALPTESSRQLLSGDGWAVLLFGVEAAK